MESRYREATRRLVLSRGRFWTYCLLRMPLAAFAGIRILSLDETGSRVLLPGGWRTRNPFGSTYFAAQAMAAELSTGAPLLALVEASRTPLAMIVVKMSSTFVKKLVGEGTFRSDDAVALKEAVERAVSSGEPQVVEARSVGRDSGGDVVSEWTFSWRIKRRSREYDGPTGGTR